jgi:hypothetical protein
MDAAGNPVVPPGSDLSNVVVAIVGGWSTAARTLGYATNKCTGKKFNASPDSGRDICVWLATSSESVCYVTLWIEHTLSVARIILFS